MSTTPPLTMQLNLKRNLLTSLSTSGLLDIDGQFECYTLERPEVQIPLGTYGIEIRYSPRFKRPLPHLLDVPGRSDILIHSGNWPRDTEGCLLVGQTLGKDMILSSRLALDPLIQKIQLALDAKQPVSLSIT
jgi:Family of unknown function (DUF5675)